jgi:hypothetical protein
MARVHSTSTRLAWRPATPQVAAEVVSVTVKLSSTELGFAFGLDNWESHVEQVRGHRSWSRLGGLGVAACPGCTPAAPPPRPAYNHHCCLTQNKPPQSLLLTNHNAFPVDYEWEMSSKAFTVTPASGRIEPKRTAEATVHWTPSVALPQAVPTTPAPVGAPGAGGDAGSKQGGGKGAAAAGGKGKGAGGAAGQPKQGPAAGEPAVGAAPDAGWLVESAAMTLRLKGGADVPQRVALVGELPSGCLRAREKEVALGPVPVGERQAAVVTLRNSGSGEAAFRVRERVAGGLAEGLALRCGKKGWPSGAGACSPKTLIACPARTPLLTFRRRPTRG